MSKKIAFSRMDDNCRSRRPFGLPQIDVASKNPANSEHLLEEWLNSKTLIKLFLIGANLILMLKTFANCLAILVDSKSLIVDYMGYFLISEQNNSPSFKLWFILINLAVFLLSVLCLVSVLLPPRFEANGLKLSLVRHFVQLELILSIVVILIMASLWFAPLKLKLDEVEWKRSMAAYKYDQFKTDSNNYLPNVGPDYDGYELAIDRIQQALGCCGIVGPEDWRRNNALALLAPSCCKNPAAGRIETVDVAPPNSETNKVNSKLETLKQSLGRWPFKWSTTGLPSVNESASKLDSSETLFYCRTTSWTLQQYPMSDLQEFGVGGGAETPGCQRLLTSREVLFTFNLRLTLLLLFATQTLLIIAALSLYNPLKSSTRKTGGASKMTADVGTNKTCPLRQLVPAPPSYWLKGHANQSYLEDFSSNSCQANTAPINIRSNELLVDFTQPVQPERGPPRANIVD